MHWSALNFDVLEFGTGILKCKYKDTEAASRRLASVDITGGFQYDLAEVGLQETGFDRYIAALGFVDQDKVFYDVMLAAAIVIVASTLGVVVWFAIRKCVRDREPQRLKTCLGMLFMKLTYYFTFPITLTTTFQIHKYVTSPGSNQTVAFFSAFLLVSFCIWMLLISKVNSFPKLQAMLGKSIYILEKDFNVGREKWWRVKSAMAAMTACIVTLLSAVDAPLLQPTILVVFAGAQFVLLFAWWPYKARAINMTACIHSILSMINALIFIAFTMDIDDSTMGIFAKLQVALNVLVWACLLLYVIAAAGPQTIRSNENERKGSSVEEIKIDDDTDSDSDSDDASVIELELVGMETASVGLV